MHFPAVAFSDWFMVQAVGKKKPVQLLMMIVMNVIIMATVIITVITMVIPIMIIKLIKIT